MNNNVYKIRSFLGGILVALSASLIAGPVTIPNTFSPNTPARAAEVNANFTAVKTAVDDNHSRLTAIETTVKGENVVLAPSGASSGNILKGADPFIHNFGTDNTFIGVNAGNFTTTGLGNTAIGVSALRNNTNGGGNTANGVAALTNNTEGADNTANGVAALTSNTVGLANTATGTRALISNTDGDSNTASGMSALASNTAGDANTAIGASSLQRNTEGSRNIAVGTSAGFNLITGDDNIAIGNRGVAVESNTIRIGTMGTHSAVHIAGINDVALNGVQVIVNNAGRLGIQISSRAYKDAIVDMGSASRVLMQLRPVTFHYKSDASQQERSLQFGLIAEEVAKVAPGLVARDDKGDAQTVYYHFLPSMLLNEYQKQQRAIEAQAAELAELKREMGRVTAALARRR